MTHADLIAEIESAPEDEQHIAIYDALKCAKRQGWINDAQFNQGFTFRNYGAYLDAALSMLPEGWEWQIISGQPGFTVVIRSPDARYETSGPNQGGTYENYLIAGQDASAIQIATPALAMSAAILKALETKT